MWASVMIHSGLKSKRQQLPNSGVGSYCLLTLSRCDNSATEESKKAVTSRLRSKSSSFLAFAHFAISRHNEAVTALLKRQQLLPLALTYSFIGFCTVTGHTPLLVGPLD